MRSLIPSALHFDPENSIIVFEYLNDYQDLSEFYEQGLFPTEVAAALGTTLAKIHQATFGQSRYEDELVKLNDDQPVNQMPRILYGLERIGTTVMSRVSQENLEFFRLYQRYESLGNAIAALKSTWQPNCLVHGDLRLSNILVSPKNAIRLIDWEQFIWGDPAYDVGTLIAGYLKLWLSSLVAHRGMDVSTMLRLAAVPIAHLQPSLAALMQAYLHQFSAIVLHQPDFLRRVLQFAGVVLIESIQIKLQYHSAFTNRDICILQVAKSLLCNSDQARFTVFGQSMSEMIHSNLVSV